MKLYCSIVGILLTLVLAKCESPPELFERIDRECEKEMGVTREFLQKNADDSRAKCFPACQLKKYGVMVNGKVVAEKMIEFGSKLTSHKPGDRAKAGLTECADKANREKEECGVAEVFTKCFEEINKPPPKP